MNPKTDCIYHFPIDLESHISNGPYVHPKLHLIHLTSDWPLDGILDGISKFDRAWVCLHTEKSCRNHIKSNQNQIVYTIFRINRKFVNTIWFRFDLIWWFDFLFQINRKVVFTIWFRFDLIWFLRVWTCFKDW